jgi:hypothetical protein
MDNGDIHKGVSEMKILTTPEQEAGYKAEKDREYASLMKGKITIRFLKHSAYWFIYSGNTRPSIQAFESTDEAEDWLRERHGIELNNEGA